jgi:hypothetical protein
LEVPAQETREGGGQEYGDIASIHISSDSDDLLQNSKKIHNTRGSLNSADDLGNRRIHGAPMSSCHP